MREIKFRYIISLVNGEEKEIKGVKVVIPLRFLKAHSGFVKLMNTEICEQNNIKREDYAYYQLVSEDEFTGLKDKNGKEIYEGDILKGKKGINFVVEYSEERGMFIASCYGGYFNFNDELAEDNEVIGNKFEHKHLLKNDN